MFKKNKKEITVMVLSLFFFSPFSVISGSSYQSSSETSLLNLLNITPSPESFDFIRNRTQFFQEQMMTEKRHPKTLNFSQMVQEDIHSGLRQLLSVEADIGKKLTDLIRAPQALDLLVGAMESAILAGNTIYIFGSGASGRLAMQMESTFWRPFWERIKNSGKLGKKLDFLGSPPIEDRLIGQMTGGDRALLGSMESLEDLMLMGWLQLQEREIERGDVVICVSESGDDPAVIGTLQAAHQMWENTSFYQAEETRKKLFFIHNNPQEQLFLFDRCREILEEPGITKIDLTTGPQSLAGSTRLQASTINTFVLGHTLQAALFRCLKRHLSRKELENIGFGEGPGLAEMLSEYPSILKEINRCLPLLSELVRLDIQARTQGGHVNYFSDLGLFTVLNDVVGSILDSHLTPLDRSDASNRNSQIQIWTDASGSEETWAVLLGRPFRGLNSSLYREPIRNVVADPYLKRAALDCLKISDSDQSSQYDFSLSARNLTHFGPLSGDVGICVMISPEEPAPAKSLAGMTSFLRLFSEENRKLAIVWITDGTEKDIEKAIQKLTNSAPFSVATILPLRIDKNNDPLGVNKQVALKVLLNSHSAAVMAGLGRANGNYLTHINPANMKLLGRATHVLQSIVNETLNSPKWVERNGINTPITFGEANAVLLASRDYLSRFASMAGKVSEISLAAIQILESLNEKKGLTHKEAMGIALNTGLNRYMSEISGRM